MNQFRKIFEELGNELKIFFIDKKSRLTQVKKYKSVKNMKLNLGCGSNLRKGFINIDLEKSADLRLDLRKRLPFVNNSVEYIYNEHFFEHLSYFDKTAIRCLVDYLRVLKKGSKMRLIVPDMDKILKAYVYRDYKFFELISFEGKMPQSKEYLSIIDQINLAAYYWGHKYCYDFEKLNLLLKSVGFKNIKRDEYNAQEDSSTEERRRYSLYTEAEK